MYIRRTTIKSRRTGEPYYSHRLVESVRTPDGVKQRTLLNLGTHFDVPPEQWAAFAQRIEQRVGGQGDWVGGDLQSRYHDLAERVAAQVVHKKARLEDGSAARQADYHCVDVGALDLVRPRSVGIEHAALEVLRQLGLDRHLERLGFNGPQQAAAIGTIIARMAAPGSERATETWLKAHSALGELIDYDYSQMNSMQLYRTSDQLLKHKAALERFLYDRERTLFEVDELITLYDLTNTYFEGQGTRNAAAARGKSKEKRSDCPLVTLALVLDASGFPKRSEVFPGNASEPATLAQMVETLAADQAKAPPTVVLDAGLASEDNLAWLVEHGYHYLVVSRKRQRQFDPQQAVIVKDQGQARVQVQRVLNPDTGEVELYCHSAQRENKERGIDQRLAGRFEKALTHLAQGLHKKRTVKRYDKVIERLGRLKEKYARVAQYYEIGVDQDEQTGNASTIDWKRIKPLDQTLPGVYCLRSNQTQWDEHLLWHTYTLLTDLEAVFRTLKSELGLRPVFHHTTERVRGHLFISVLAYHLVHAMRLQLKACQIDLSWASIRRDLEGQVRVTAELQRADGRMVHVRKATRPEPRQQNLYNALGIADRPGRTETTVI